MSRRLSVIAAVMSVLVVGHAPAGAGEEDACGDIYPSMALGPLPAEADTVPFFYGMETAAGSFSVQFSGIDCGFELRTTAAYAASSGSAGAGDYSLSPGRTDPVCGTPRPDCPHERSVSVTLLADGELEQVAESFTLVLSDPQVNGNSYPSALSPPSSAAFLVLDADPPSRVAFDELVYSRSETYLDITIPVWRAGPLSGSASVSYAVGPGPGAPATQGEDYTVLSPNPLEFGPNDPVEVIRLGIVNDKISESEESIELTLLSAVGPALDEPSTKVVTIIDNEENVAPRSRFHHPRHKWKYKKSDYRIREFHVFAHDEEGGSGVVAAEIALRRKLTNGRCSWKVQKGWQRKDCDNPNWLSTKYDETGDLYYYRMPQLKPSVKTRVKNYRAYSRALDGAGNVEKELRKKRNDNTFEIKRSRRRR